MGWTLFQTNMLFASTYETSSELTYLPWSVRLHELMVYLSNSPWDPWDASMYIGFEHRLLGKVRTLERSIFVQPGWTTHINSPTQRTVMASIPTTDIVDGVCQNFRAANIIFLTCARDIACHDHLEQFVLRSSHGLSFFGTALRQLVLPLRNTPWSTSNQGQPNTKMNWS